MKISEIITDKYKLRMPPTVYYELLADVVEAEEEQEPTLEDVKGYCKPRNLTIITNELLYELTHPKIKALQQEPILDKIRAEIEQAEIGGYIRDAECFRAGLNRALNIIDKYKAESEPQETETWNGIHAQITAPKGTFDKIWEEAESEG